MKTTVTLGVLALAGLLAAGCGYDGGYASGGYGYAGPAYAYPAYAYPYPAYGYPYAYPPPVFFDADGDHFHHHDVRGFHHADFDARPAGAHLGPAPAFHGR